MTVLVLAGTAEAREVLSKLKKQPVIASLAGATRAPADLGVQTRIGGFGGLHGFRAYLSDQSITAVLDATHPFASQMTRTAADTCRALNIPYAVLQRPGWMPEPGDRWTFVDTVKEAASYIPDRSTVFVGTGRQTLAEYACLSACTLLVRVIDPPVAPFPFANGAFLVGKPPFSVQEEVRLFQKHGVDWMIVKNSGGDKSKSKLDAARHLNIPVLLLNRPALPDCTRFETVADALTWVDSVG